MHTMACTEDDVIRIERRGEVSILRPSAQIESLNWDLIQQAAEVVLQPIRSQPAPLVLVALNELNYFGSVFLSLLLRCWKTVCAKGGMMVLCGASKQTRELLRITALDTLWAIYDTEGEAIRVLESD
jgi:anti-anti-sigma factor